MKTRKVYVYLSERNGYPGGPLSFTSSRAAVEQRRRDQGVGWTCGPIVSVPVPLPEKPKRSKL